MLSLDKNWILTLVTATLAVALALVGLGLTGSYPGAAPLVGTSVLAGSLVCTAVAFGRLAIRVRRLELENEGLVEEISQEFDRVKDKIEIFQEALAEPEPAGPVRVEDVPLRRVAVK